MKMMLADVRCQLARLLGYDKVGNEQALEAVYRAACVRLTRHRDVR